MENKEKNSNILEILENYDKESGSLLSSKRKERNDETLILVVEDENFSRKLLIDSLKIKWKYTVLSALNGAQAAEHYINSAPDIVFLNIELPDCDGQELLQKISEIDPDSFVIMTTAHTATEDIKYSIYSGAKGYLAKPITALKLEEHIEIYLKKMGKI